MTTIRFCGRPQLQLLNAPELVVRRADAAYLVETFAATQRKACELAHIARSSYRYRPDPEKDHKLTEKLAALAADKPCYGYRGLGVLLGREGEKVSHMV